MAARLRMPTLAFAALSICLSVAILGCAARTIHVFNSQQKSNAWLLPIWPNHFDIRELQALIGTSAAVLVLNVVLALPLLVPSLPARFIILFSSVLSAMCSIVAIVFPTILNQRAPTKDTLQTWTCRWSHTSVSRGQGPPAQFDTICQETRFAFYTTIPVFVIQMLLVGVAIYTMAIGRHPAPTRLGSDAEKGQMAHELGDVDHISFETKSESPRSVHQGDKVEA